MVHEDKELIVTMVRIIFEPILFFIAILAIGFILSFIICSAFQAGMIKMLLVIAALFLGLAIASYRIIH
jgi:hypothetical protein